MGNYWAKGKFAKPLTSTAKLFTNSLFRNKSTYLPTIRYKACTLNNTYYSLWMVCFTCKLKGWFSVCLDALESWLLNFLIAKCLSLAFPLLQIEPSFHRWMSYSKCAHKNKITVKFVLRPHNSLTLGQHFCYWCEWQTHFVSNLINLNAKFCFEYFWLLQST